MTTTSYTPPPAAPEKLYTRGAEYPYLFRLLHWVLWPSLVILALTGLSQHAVSSPQWSLFKGVLPEFFWPGRVHLIHRWASLAFAPAVLAVTWIYFQKRVRFRLAHFLLLVGGTAMVVSGIWLLGWSGPPAAYVTARWVHAVTGLVVLPIAFLWHALAGLTRYRRGLPWAFRIWCWPQGTPLVCFLPLALLTTCLILNGLPVAAPWRDLPAKRIDAADRRTGQLDGLPWDTTKPLRMAIADGMGFDGGRTEVTLRALHDGRELFVMAEWLDPTEDRRYMPWEKTADGWKQLVTNPDDESTYYEDKFSLIFPAEPDWQFDRFGCAVQCHAGGGRAYGYKGSERIVDVWHWKSTRTDPVGQVDDKYWSEVDLTAKDVGRHGDPKDGGGYQKNVSENKTHPAFLPQSPVAVKQGILFTERAVPYTPEAAAGIRVGQIVPGIVASAAVGDRGDVACISRHEDGRWRLYLRRKLETGSPYDAQFTPGRTYCFGCAAFDCSSKRHAYNMFVYRLVLEE